MKTRPFYFTAYAAVMIMLAGLLLALEVQAKQAFLGTWLPSLLDIEHDVATVAGLLALTALLSLRASRFFKFYLPVFTIAFLTIAPPLLTTHFGLDAIQLRTFSALFVLAHMPFGFGAHRRVLLNSRLRWWLVPNRKLLDLPVSIKTVRGHRITAMSFDVSAQGIFVNIDQPFFEQGSPVVLNGMIEGSRASLKIVLSRFHEVQCEAQVVRTQTDRRGQYPTGLAFKFLGLALKDRVDIQQALDHLGTKSMYRV